MNHLIFGNCDSWDRSEESAYPRRVLPRLLTRLTRLIPLIALALVTPTLTTSSAAAAPPKRHIQYAEWRGATLAEGSFAGTVLRRDWVRIDQPVGTRTYGGTPYDVGRWLSPWHEPGFALTELVASWQAKTPGNSWVEVQVRGRNAQGRRSSWDTLGRWAAGDQHIRRTSVGGQGDDLADVNVDTWQVPGGAVAWQLRVNLMRAGPARPKVRAVGAMASRLPDVDDGRTGVDHCGLGMNDPMAPAPVLVLLRLGRRDEHDQRRRDDDTGSQGSRSRGMA